MLSTEMIFVKFVKVHFLSMVVKNGKGWKVLFISITANAKLGSRRGACGAMELSDRYPQFGALAFAMAQIAERVSLPGYAGLFNS